MTVSPEKTLACTALYDGLDLHSVGGIGDEIWKLLSLALLSSFALFNLFSGLFLWPLYRRIQGADSTNLSFQETLALEKLPRGLCASIRPTRVQIIKER